MRKMTAYLSGPITGIKEDNEPLFREWQEALVDLGYDVIVPHDLDPRCESPNWNDWMRACIRAMMDADFILTIPEQSFSRGREVELEIARRINIPIIHFSKINRPALVNWPEDAIWRSDLELTQISF